jgi:putative ABC transport system permease protein
MSREDINYVEPSFFQIFTFPFLSGNPAHALDNPQDVILTKDMAIRLFGSADVVGRPIEIKTDTAYVPFVVKGVAANLPSNSIFDRSIFVSYKYAEAHAEARAMTDWNETMGDETFVLLRRGTHIDDARLSAFWRAHHPDDIKDLIKNKQWNGRGTPPIRFELQPLGAVHTDTSIDGNGNPVDPFNVWLLIAMASAVLLIACINFTTLAIGRSAGRAKEIGVRKVVGSARRQLIVQFMAESLVLTLLSFVLALLLVWVLLPTVEQLTGLAFHIPWLSLCLLLLALVVFTGLLAGAYPALVLSSFKPLEVLKSKVRLRGANIFTRSLVVVQFVLSASLAISTLILIQQLSYMKSRNLGFTKENVIDINTDGVDMKKLYPIMRQSILSQPGVVGVSSAQIGIGEGNGFMGSGYHYQSQDGFSFEYPVSPGYIGLMGIKLLYGRDFNPTISTDSVTSIIVNLALLDEYHISPNQAIGQSLTKPNDHGTVTNYTIIGVVRNFNFSSLSQKVGPQLFFWPSDLEVGHVYVRVSPGDPAGQLASLGSTWRRLVPGLPFSYQFLDEEMRRFYLTETKWTSIIGWAGGIAVCLACLGLFGLAALVAVNRSKEFSIRKVLGASTFILVRLIAVDFSWLVMIALLIASPLAWYFTHRWLQNYAYHISVSWWAFGVSAFVLWGLALLTVSYHALRAAWANPVDKLKEE